MFYQDLQHEVNHIWEQYKDGQTYPNYEKMFKANSGFYSNNEIEKTVGRLIYYADRGEQDSFISSVYAYARQEYPKHMENLNTILKKTDAFNAICKMKQLFSIVLKNKDRYAHYIKSTYGFKTFDMFERRIRAAIKRFEKKFAMVSRKCTDDLIIWEPNTAWFGDKENLYKL